MRIILIALILSSMQSCSVIAVNSNEQYLTIGQSKREVIRQLQQDGIQAVLPELTNEVYVNSSNVREVDRLRTSNTIILRGQRFNARIHFSEGVVSDLFLSDTNDGKSYGIQIGNTKDVVLSKIVSAIRGNTGLRGLRSGSRRHTPSAPKMETACEHSISAGNIQRNSRVTP